MPLLRPLTRTTAAAAVVMMMDSTARRHRPSFRSTTTRHRSLDREGPRRRPFGVCWLLAAIFVYVISLFSDSSNRKAVSSKISCHQVGRHHHFVSSTTNHENLLRQSTPHLVATPRVATPTGGAITPCCKNRQSHILNIIIQQQQNTPPKDPTPAPSPDTTTRD